MSRGDDALFEIPAERLPPGWVETIGVAPANPAEPRPAATAVLVRDGAEGLEVLLLRRHRSSGFVPGAYVFPGGRVDAADADPALHARVKGLAEPPDAPFWIGAAREVFEETGVLLGRDAVGRWLPGASVAPELEGQRAALMDDATSLDAVLTALGATLDLSALAHVAHWVTPIVEPRRYDTHFFLAALPDGAVAAPDPREMTDAVWLTPDAALARFRAGTLPMVFPTVKTIEALSGQATVDAALAEARARTVRRILPRLVRTPGGVGIVVDQDDQAL